MTSARVDATRIGFTSTDVPEGSNLYYTTARLNSDFDTRLGVKTTANIAEGSNLYYTDARVRACVLTGLSLATSTAITASDSALVAFGKLQAQVSLAGTSISARKTATESVTSSTVLQDDNHLLITVAANTNYVITGTFYVTSASATPDFKMAFVTPSGTIAVSYAALVIGAGSSPSRGADVLSTSGVAGNAITIGAGEVLIVQIQGTISVGVTGGTFKLQWAQNTSSGTATTINAGGFLSAVKI